MLLSSLGYLGHMWEHDAMWIWFMVYARSVLSTQDVASGMAASLLNFAVIAIGAVVCLLGGLMSDRWGRKATTTGMPAGSRLCAVLIGFAFDIWPLPAIADSHDGWR